jgi:hypothetical protein
MAAKKKAAKRGRSAQTVKQRLTAIEKQWVAGLLAPGEALQVCLESGMPEHEWPAWIVPAAVPMDPQPEIRTQKLKPMTGPQQTKFLAALALWADRKYGVGPKAAAGAAIAAYNRLPNVRPPFPEGADVVGRVVKEMAKQRKDPAFHFALSGEQVSRLIPYIPASRKNLS